MLQMKKNISEANLINVIDKNIFKTFVYDCVYVCAIDGHREYHEPIYNLWETKMVNWSKKFE